MNTAPAITLCGYCGSRHDYVNPYKADEPILCKHCQTCFKYCQHTELCNWPDPNIQTVKAVIPVNKASEVVTTNLKEAFESWFTSSELRTTTDVEAAWKDFNLYASEILTPVDVNKKYLHLQWKDGKVKEIDLLDANKLHTNQTGEYVVVDGKKRVRIGKDVAVM